MQFEILESNSNILNEVLKIYNAKNKVLPYLSINYLKTINTTLNAKLKFLIASNEGKINGYLPIIEKKTEYGIISNSLPFFGSIGSFVCVDEFYDYSKLFNFIDNYNKNNNVASYSYITDPFNNDYKTPDSFKSIQKRIQVTQLPLDKNKIINFEFYDPRVRRNIKKAINSKIEIKKEFFSEDNIMDFHKIHDLSMKLSNGNIKPKNFFIEFLKYANQQDYSLYFAYKENIKISAILLLKNKFIYEYFIPCTLPEFRNLQPSSLIIHNAFLESINNNIFIWNWGGTGFNQHSLYEFKKKWGGEDRKYKLIYKLYDEKIINIPDIEIKKKCDGFFVKPFIN